MAKFDPFLSLDCARVEGVGPGAIQGKEGIKFCHLETLGIIDGRTWKGTEQQSPFAFIPPPSLPNAQESSLPPKIYSAAQEVALIPHSFLWFLARVSRNLLPRNRLYPIQYVSMCQGGPWSRVVHQRIRVEHIPNNPTKVQGYLSGLDRAFVDIQF